MTCLCGLDGDIGRFQVTDFTHHDDVGILPQKRLEGRREGQARLFIDIDLVDAREVDFRRVFCRGNIDRRRIQDIEAGIERHGLARASRPRHQDHAVGALDSV
ncbi:hypothetical protein D3C72_1580720 [compost metagenome]